MPITRFFEPRCSSAGRVTARLLLSALVIAPLAASIASADATHARDPELPPLEPIQLPPSDPSLDPAARPLEFTLKHVFHHGTYDYPLLHRRLDVRPEEQLWVVDEEDTSARRPAPQYHVRPTPMNIERLADRSRSTIDSILEVGRMTGSAVNLPLSAWTTDEIPGPNVTDKETILSFARMAADAYVVEPNTGDWEDVGQGFNYTEDFGWESDGLRGHIFADTTNSTVVIGLKGTSPAVFDGSETTTNDKINDNLFFSCCCGQGGQFLWRQVCDCQTSTYQCNSTCLVQALRKKNRYYYAAQDLYHNVTELYPDADVWVTGHSLGGAVSSLLGLTFGLPVVTFEAVPEAMPASRLGLPVPPGHQVGTMQARQNTGAFHFGHTADPVYMGTCNTASSTCTFGGYAMQSVCHTGLKCVYDTVHDLGWRVGIGTHKIAAVIRDVIEKYEQPAKCEPYANCTDCYPWEFYESNGTETTTTVVSSTTSLTRTRTSTCKTPGWWGCLDESTTTGGSTTTTSTTTTSTTTTTCKTPGWFGCKDKTTKTTSTALPAPTVTTTSSTPTSTTPTSTMTCTHPGFFGGCWDPVAGPPEETATTTTKPEPPSDPWGRQEMR